jgi:hypothetical protein
MERERSIAFGSADSMEEAERDAEEADAPDRMVAASLSE